MAELTAPQQNRLLAGLSNLLRRVEQDSGPEFLPRGLDVMGLVRQLALPSAETVEKLSYGDPLFRMPTQSNIPITTDRGYLAEVLGLAPAASAASRATTRLSNEAADALVRQITGNQQATAQGALQAAGEMAPLARIFTPQQAKTVIPETKAVDESGNPVMVYHGTADPIEQFSKEKLGESTRAQSAKQGFFFQDNPAYARNYADYAANDARVKSLVDRAFAAEKRGNFDEYDDLIRQAEELEATQRKEYGAGQNIYPAYLDMKNPFVFDAKGESYTYIEDSLTNIIKKAKKEGHDGVIFRNLDDIPGRTNAISDHYVVFEPEQIKSAVSDPAFTGLLEPQAGARPMFETGREVTFPFIKNTEKAPKTTGFAQEIEPAGNYILSGEDVDVAKLPQGWTSGEVTFKNPLVLDWGKSGLYSEPDNWKQVLSSQYGGKTGKALSKAIAKDGYDGIVTINEYGPSEIVDLTMFAK